MAFRFILTAEVKTAVIAEATVRILTMDDAVTLALKSGDKVARAAALPTLAWLAEQQLGADSATAKALSLGELFKANGRPRQGRYGVWLKAVKDLIQVDRALPTLVAAGKPKEALDAVHAGVAQVKEALLSAPDKGEQGVEGAVNKLHEALVNVGIGKVDGRANNAVKGNEEKFASIVKSVRALLMKLVEGKHPRLPDYKVPNAIYVVGKQLTGEMVAPEFVHVKPIEAAIARVSVPAVIVPTAGSAPPGTDPTVKRNARVVSVRSKGRAAKAAALVAAEAAG